MEKFYEDNIVLIKTFNMNHFLRNRYKIKNIFTPGHFELHLFKVSWVIYAPAIRIRVKEFGIVKTTEFRLWALLFLMALSNTWRHCSKVFFLECKVVVIELHQKPDSLVTGKRRMSYNMCFYLCDDLLVRPLTSTRCNFSIFLDFWLTQSSPILGTLNILISHLQHKIQ